MTYAMYADDVERAKLKRLFIMTYAMYADVTGHW